jgi:copper chaperone CopZ
MESATIRTRTIEIDGMTGDACVQKVTGALKGVHGVTTQSVKVGCATIGADQTGCNAACSAIGNAGFKSRETVRTGEACGSTPAAAKTQLEPKAANTSNAPAQNPPVVDAATANVVGGSTTERFNANTPAKPATPAVAGAL